MIGERFGRLVVLSNFDSGREKSGHRRSIELCVCDCGTFVKAVKKLLINGSTKSCGCLSVDRLIERSTTHNLRKHPLYHTWVAMRQRCNNPNNKDYKHYGERGISVCDEWDNFETFLKDMGEPPSGYTIERKDVNGNYSKENCVWEDVVIQAQNKGVRSDNKTGVTGVYKNENHWIAAISFLGKRRKSKHKTFEDACFKRKEYEKEKEQLIEEYKRLRSEENT